MYTIDKILYNQKNNKKIAIIQGERRLSYKDWYNSSSALSKIIKSKAKSQNVAIFIENSIEFSVVFFGIIYAGKTVIPLDMKLTKKEMMETIRFCEVDLIISVESNRMKILSIFEGESNIPYLLCIDNKDELILQDCDKYDRLISTKDVAIIFKTSGTTNNPKYVMLTHANVIFNITQNIKALELSEEEISLIVLPMCFAYCNVAQFLTHVKIGATMIITNDIFWFKNMDVITYKQKITNLFCVPSVIVMLHRYMKKKSRRILPSKICIGGDRMAYSNLMEIIATYSATEFIVTYGQTEAGPRISTLRGEMILQKPRSVGIALDGVELKIVDKDGTKLGANQIGELVIKSNSVMKGYFKADKLTREVIKGGWLYTGDIAYMDFDQYLYLIGRKKNIIISEGRNIFPEEIEEILKECEYVKDILVYGQKNEKYGEQVIAKIVIKGGRQNLKNVIAFCRNNLSIYKVPTKWECVDLIEKTISGKTKRK